MEAFQKIMRHKSDFFFNQDSTNVCNWAKKCNVKEVDHHIIFLFHDFFGWKKTHIVGNFLKPTAALTAATFAKKEDTAA